MGIKHFSTLTCDKCKVETLSFNGESVNRIKQLALNNGWSIPSALNNNEPYWCSFCSDEEQERDDLIYENL